MATCTLFLMLMLPTMDVYQQYPPESWLKVKIYKHGVEYIWPNKAAEKGKFGNFFKENKVLLKHLLRNVVVVNLDRDIKDKKRALNELKKNKRFKDLLDLMLSKEKVLQPVTVKEICQASLKYFRPNYSKLAEGKDGAFHRCIYPTQAEIPADSMVLVDALGYSALANMDKKSFKIIKQAWEAHIAKMFAKNPPGSEEAYRQLLAGGRETFAPNKMLSDQIKAEYLKLQAWMPFELSE